MKKVLTYSTFGIASVVVVLIFLTSKSYTQLIIAALLYPPLVYFALKIFPRNGKGKEWKTAPIVEIEIPAKTTSETQPISKPQRVDVADIDKRAFLKLIGAAGLSFFLFSIISKRAEVPFFGKLAGSSTTALQDITGNKIDPAQNYPTDGYRISEMDDNTITYYGFTNNNGAWFIMKEDTETGSFRYFKGNTSFTNNWVKRQQLNYDYYHNIF